MLETRSNLSVAACRRGTKLHAAVVGVLASAASAVGSSTPSFWSDEVATIRAARLPWATLFSFVQHKDAVHTLYYCLMHVWIAAFGQTEFAVRSFSSLAVGVAAAGVVVLGAALKDERFGLIAGIVFAMLPRTTYMGSEGRSYALTTALAVWFTIALVSALKRGRIVDWGIYAGLGALCFYCFIYLLLLVPVHIVALALLPGERRRKLIWASSIVAAVLATAPMLILAASQKSQIAWLRTEPVVNVWTIVVEPFFDSSWSTTGVVILILTWALIMALRRGKRAPSAVFWLSLSWAILPVVLLLFANAVDGPLYLARYLSFCTPGIAILLAQTIGQRPKRWISAVLLIVIALASAPTYVSQRTNYAKDGGSDLRQVAFYIGRLAVKGDSFYFEAKGPNVARPRLALYAYPYEFRQLNDIGLVSRFATDNDWTFADRTRTLTAAMSQIRGTERLWLIRPLAGDRCAANLASERAAYMTLSTTHSTHSETICMYAPAGHSN